MGDLTEAARDVVPADPAEVDLFVAQWPTLQEHAILKLKRLDPRLQKMVMSKSLENAREPTAVLLTRCSQANSLRPGDWICPGCYEVQFAFRSSCGLCSAPRPLKP